MPKKPEIEKDDVSLTCVECGQNQTRFLADDEPTCPECIERLYGIEVDDDDDDDDDE